MSLPEKLRVYLLIDMKKHAIVYATHDAELAVLVKNAHVEGGGVIDILPVVSTRRPQAEWQTEHRCFACPTPHTVYIEATASWTSRMFETACESTPGRAKQFELENGWRLN